MGTLRLLLAFAVVAGHGAFFRPFFALNAKAAVICFFVISGFYMALVLNEKYTSKAEFFVNRLVRIYPAYIAMTLIYAGYLAYFGRLNQDASSIFLNISLVGQDVARMLYAYPINVSREPLGVDIIPISQAWSLSVELQLYAFAALLFWSLRGIVIALVAGIAMRLYLQSIGYGNEPYGGMLVLNVLAFFALGGLGYYAYKAMHGWSKATLGIIVAVLSGALLAYLYEYEGLRHLEAQGTDTRFLPVYALIALLVPPLFALTKDNAIDRLLGDLSYPVYLCHVFVLDLVVLIDPVTRFHLDYAGKCSFTFVAVMYVAIALHRFVDIPARQWKRVHETQLGVSHQL